MAWRGNEQSGVTQDHYAILGVSPTADPAAIRAAYLALMREFHPDRNSSPAATLRAQAIIAAFKVLGDFDQRSYYDWDRRRERERTAAALAAAPKRNAASIAVAALTIGLAAAGAVMLRPESTPVPRPAEPRAAEPAQAAARAIPARRKRMTVIALDNTARPAPRPRALPDKVAAKTLASPAPVRAERPVAVEMKSARGIAGRPLPKPAPRLAKAEPVRAAAQAPTQPAAIRKPAQRVAIAKSTPARPADATDLASLDQFVMAFYGQSWRFGDSRKRASLERSRNAFVVRRAGCAEAECKRAAYLKLMRDVSEIVESGETEPR